MIPQLCTSEYIKNAFQLDAVAVFDSPELPGKSETHKARRTRRNAIRFNDFRQGVQDTEEMTRNVVQCFKDLGINFAVALFEADAQLFWLQRNREIISNDSDLIPYGATSVFFRLGENRSRSEGDYYDSTVVRMKLGELTNEHIV